MSEKNGNGKIIKAVTTIALFLGLVIAFCELKDYIAWAEDVDRLEDVIAEKVEDVRVMVAQTYNQMRRDQTEQTLNNLRLQEYQWMLMLQKNPNDPVILQTLERIRGDIALEQEKLKGQ